MPTTRYLLLYRSNKDAPRQTPSPAEMEQAMAEWNAWKTKFQDEIIDMGDGLTPVGAVCRSTGVTDGPYIEGKEHIGGFTVIKAPDLDAALEWGRKSARAITLPIEVRPFQSEH